jgi:hypothetical protein
VTDAVDALNLQRIVDRTYARGSYPVLNLGSPSICLGPYVESAAYAAIGPYPYPSTTAPPLVERCSRCYCRAYGLPPASCAS